MSTSPLSSSFPTFDPFLMCGWHEDHYPAGDALMQVPVLGPYPMFGSRTKIPGFPQHPHRGFETVTVPIEGFVDHADSMGNAGRYGNGDLQWLTTGRGVAHSEMFPLLHHDRPNTFRGFQIWLNLPSRAKMSQPHFVMHWADSIPRFMTPDGRTKVAVWAGSLFGATGLPPPPSSWAADPRNDVAIWFLEMAPGAQLTLPPAQPGSNRALYIVEGDAVRVGPRVLGGKTMATLHAAMPAPVHNAGMQSAAILVLQGKPINEPVVNQGPFVMNSQQEIMQSFAEYQQTRFGGWPWPQDGMVFPREKGRFALTGGVETFPPHRP